MKAAQIIGVGLALGIAGLLLRAWRLPVTTTATREAAVAAPLATVFALVTDIAAQPRWRRDVAAVTVAADGTTWTESLRRGGTVEFTREALVPDQRFAITYRSSLGFSGRWVGRFTARDAQSTTVQLEETTTIPSPIGRLVASLVAPPGAHLDLWLADLQGAVSSDALTRTR